MVPITVTYQGGLRCGAGHGPSHATLITDAPVDNHGQGAAFSPTDLVATGFATCLATTMGIVAQRDGIVLDGLTIAAEKHMTTSPPRRIARLVARVVFPASLAAAARDKLERAARACPVALSLHPDVVQDVTFTTAD